MMLAGAEGVPQAAEAVQQAVFGAKEAHRLLPQALRGAHAQVHQGGRRNRLFPRPGAYNGRRRQEPLQCAPSHLFARHMCQR